MARKYGSDKYPKGFTTTLVKRAEKPTPKPTPGPRKVDHRDHPDKDAAKAGVTGYRIITDDDGSIVTVAEIFSRGYTTVAVNPANARLIAAAPDMLSTLKSLGASIGLVQDYLSDVDEDDESGDLLISMNKLMGRVEAAITKAEGA